jgi:hypothetical protein
LYIITNKMNTSIHIEGWREYTETQEPIPEPQTPSQLPPERYPEPVWSRSLSPWSAYELAEKKKQAATQTELDADRSTDSAVAATEAVRDRAFEELAAPIPAKPPRAKPGPKPKPKPPPKKPGRKLKAKVDEKGKRVHLTEDEHLTLFHLCNFHAEAYRKSDNVKFWTVITAKFEKETGKNHSSLRRVVNTRCNKRRADVAAEGSGEAQNNSERAIQEDAWIKAVDEDNRILADRKDRAAGIAGESAAAEHARGAMMHSQAERARAQTEVIRPRSWKPAKKVKQTSGLTTD